MSPGCARAQCAALRSVATGDDESALCPALPPTMPLARPATAGIAACLRSAITAAAAPSELAIDVMVDDDFPRATGRMLRTHFVGARRLRSGSDDVRDRATLRLPAKAIIAPPRGVGPART